MLIVLTPLLFGLSFLSGMVDKRGALVLIVITTIGAPIGVWLLQFASHLGTATFDWPLVIITSIASVIGSWLGARFTAGKVKSATLSRIFAVALVLLAAQRAWILLT